jgi:hypothetical protein
MSDDKILSLFIYFLFFIRKLKPRSIPFVLFLKLLECFVGKSDIHIFKITQQSKLRLLIPCLQINSELE